MVIVLYSHLVLRIFGYSENFDLRWEADEVFMLLMMLMLRLIDLVGRFILERGHPFNSLSNNPTSE